MKRIQLEYFVDVVDCESMNKAAEQLYISQPTLSRSIKALEDEMGKQLLERSNHGIVPTPVGKVFYYYARSILKQFQMLDKLRELDKEKVFSRLSVSVYKILLKDDMILEFYQEMNSMDTEIRFTETTAEVVVDNVVKRNSELGILVMNDYQLKVLEKTAELHDLEIEILGISPLMVHINEKYWSSQEEEVRVGDVFEFVYIHLPQDFFWDLNQSIVIDGIQLADVKRTVTINNYHSIVNMLNHAPSFLFGHKWQVEELEHSRIHGYRIKNCNIKNYFVILKRRQDILSREAEVFLKILRKNYESI